jgi:hypothetical protein
MDRLRQIGYCSLLLLASSCLGQAQEVPRSENQEINLETYVALLRQDVNSQKVAIISQLMHFTPEQASAFWPIYTEYSKEIAKLGDEKLAGIKEWAANYGSMSEQKVDEIASKALDLESRRAAVKKAYYERIKKAMTAKTAARFLQIENQLLMILDLQVASSLPAVE